MWGDPYGGWSFGSRYLIPTYAFLSIGIALLLSHCRWKGLCLLLFFLVFLSSAAVNTVGALSSSLNPPRIEVLSLEEITGVEQKFTVDRNWQYLEEKGTKSFAYAVFFDKYLSPRGYYNLVYGMIILLALSVAAYFVILGARRATRDPGGEARVQVRPKEV